MSAIVAILNHGAPSNQQGWIGDATLLPFGGCSGEKSLSLAKDGEVTNRLRSTPARPLHESPILAGFFCTGAAALPEGGAIVSAAKAPLSLPDQAHLLHVRAQMKRSSMETDA